MNSSKSNGGSDLCSPDYHRIVQAIRVGINVKVRNDAKMSVLNVHDRQRWHPPQPPQTLQTRQGYRWLIPPPSATRCFPRILN
jgi:hypothetical protein